MSDERKLIEAIKHECKLNAGGLYEKDIIKIINEHFDNNNARTVQNLVSEIDKLEKALDKACEFIGCNFDCPYATLNQCTLDDRCSDDYKECWKEWLLDEVKE